MRSLAALLVLLALCLPAAATAGDASPAPPEPTGAGDPALTWAGKHLDEVVLAGVMGLDGGSFRPADPLTRGELYAALGALSAVGAVGTTAKQPADPGRTVTMRELDAQLVGALGLSAAAKRFRLAARDAGLEPTGMLGTETVARLLGLRFNHPLGQDQLELLPSEPATRAEAAFSLARVLALTPDQLTWLDELSQTFAVPELDELQRTVLSRALRLVGYPYVWAGMSEKRQLLWSTTVPGTQISRPGGFDCSGFVWRVYKAQPFAGSPFLSETLKGRTTYAMSGEVKKNQRIGFAGLQPGDVIFFGNRGPSSKPIEVGHSGIYVGNGWFVHSSRGGVTLQLLEGWFRADFAWARRPLAEAGPTP